MYVLYRLAYLSFYSCAASHCVLLLYVLKILGKWGKQFFSLYHPTHEV